MVVNLVFRKTHQQTDVHESITKQDRNNINDPQKKHRIGTVSKNILLQGFNWFNHIIGLRIDRFSLTNTAINEHEKNVPCEAWSRGYKLFSCSPYQKYHNQILESGVRPPLMARIWCSEMTLQDLTVLTSSRNTKINRTSLVFLGRACCRT